uniref:hypothetical protein n=1 Tax=Yoonia sp. TaxID=2212373 RepID=UPI00404716C0
MNSNNFGTEELNTLIGRVIFIAALVFLYLQLYIGLPFLPFFISTFLLLPWIRGSNPTVKILLLVLPFMMLSLASIVLRIPEEFVSQGRSWVLLLLTLTSSCILALRIRTLGQRRIQDWFFWVSVFLIGAAVLEILGPLKAVSDQFRSIAYSDNILYLNEARDLSMAGFVRPKVFTSEPSHLGKFTMFAIVLFAIASGKVWKAIALTVIGFAVIKSAVILFAVPIIFSIKISQGAANTKRSFVRMVLVVAALLVTGAIIYWLAADRLGFGSDKIEASAFLRIIRPMYVMALAISERPFFGFGLGAENELVRLYSLGTFAFPDQIYAQQRFAETLSAVGGNIHFSVPTQLGIVGTLIWLLFLENVRRIFSSPALVFWTFYIMYGFALGAVNTPLFVAPLFVVAATSNWVRTSRTNLISQPNSKVTHYNKAALGER